ncbi:PAS domain-containing sensor histidine kinase [Dickeya poaceiphila]|uniref:PAS domain S-box protein n=1 Tax=Dickeya poaceiphila TaxID=568768 RepID=A0A5B8ICG0_9GAMM|nr:PAS domain S-box protein [Dickeya poaceiphila]QDX29940.1 PAS domain S-box protein [Dickeya poaceiphila]
MLYTPTSPQPYHLDDVPPLALVDFAFSRIKDAIYIVNDVAQFCYVNDEACRMLGYSRREFRRMRVQDITPDWKKEETNRHWYDPHCGKSELTVETRHKTRLGIVLPVEVSVNHFLHKRRKYSMCVVRDIRERQHIEQLAYAREQEFRTLAENIPALIIRFDPQLNCLYANPATLAYLRFTAEQVYGRQLTDLLPHSRCVVHILQRVQQVADSKKSIEDELEEESDAAAMHHRRSYHLRCVPEFDQNGSLTSILAVGHDITVIRYTEKKREDAQMRLLARQRELSREEERKHIAREIHDELGQLLTSMRMSLSLMCMQFTRDNPPTLTQLQNLMALSDKTIQVVRQVATRLRPNVLNMGLTPALEWLRDDFIRQYGCPCLLRTPASEVVLNDECATAAFRVVQESLTNIARYAEATQVVIALENREGVIVLSVCDNGKGFDTQNGKPHTFGLMSMKERGRMLGGEVIIESQPGAGTLVRLTFPQETAA